MGPWAPVVVMIILILVMFRLFSNKSVSQDAAAARRSADVACHKAEQAENERKSMADAYAKMSRRVERYEDALKTIRKVAVRDGDNRCWTITDIQLALHDQGNYVRKILGKQFRKILRE